MIDVQIRRIEDIYRAIDTTYMSAQRHYGFNCKGCETNCCATRFYHYTHAEAIYLKRGFDTLSEETRRDILDRTDEYERFYSSGGQERPFFCPLNSNALCILYEWRPMICRLHGLPYEIQDISMTPTFYGGCTRFISQYRGAQTAYRTINRTIFYREMAKVEAEIRDGLNLGPPPQRTVADMLLEFRQRYG